MNAEELQAALQPFFDNVDEISVSVYAILKGQDGNDPRKLDIEADALQVLKALFMRCLREKISEREELTVLNLSTSDERIDAIYVYDIEIPAELEGMEDVVTSDNLPLLNLAECDLSGIKALLIEIGNNIGQIVLYKSMAPVNILAELVSFSKSLLID